MVNSNMFLEKGIRMCGDGGTAFVSKKKVIKCTQNTIIVLGISIGIAHLNFGIIFIYSYRGCENTYFEKFK